MYSSPTPLQKVPLQSKPFSHPTGKRSSTPKGDDVGDPLLLQKVREVKPLVHVFGHVHHGYGKLKDSGTLFLNAASINESYQPLHAPIVFDILPNK